MQDTYKPAGRAAGYLVYLLYILLLENLHILHRYCCCNPCSRVIVSLYGPSFGCCINGVEGPTAFSTDGPLRGVCFQAMARRSAVTYVLDLSKWITSSCMCLHAWHLCWLHSMRPLDLIHVFHCDVVWLSSRMFLSVSHHFPCLCIGTGLWTSHALMDQDKKLLHVS